jgi:hypothetical protein
VERTGHGVDGVVGGSRASITSSGKYLPLTTFLRLVAHTRLTFIFTITGSFLLASFTNLFHQLLGTRRAFPKSRHCLPIQD